MSTSLSSFRVPLRTLSVWCASFRHFSPSSLLKSMSISTRSLPCGGGAVMSAVIRRDGWAQFAEVRGGHLGHLLDVGVRRPADEHVRRLLARCGRSGGPEHRGPSRELGLTGVCMISLAELLVAGRAAPGGDPLELVTREACMISETDTQTLLHPLATRTLSRYSMVVTSYIYCTPHARCTSPRGVPHRHFQELP